MRSKQVSGPKEISIRSKAICLPVTFAKQLFEGMLSYQESTGIHDTCICYPILRVSHYCRQEETHKPQIEEKVLLTERMEVLV